MLCTSDTSRVRWMAPKHAGLSPSPCYAFCYAQPVSHVQGGAHDLEQHLRANTAQLRQTSATHTGVATAETAFGPIAVPSPFQEHRPGATEHSTAEGSAAEVQTGSAVGTETPEAKKPPPKSAFRAGGPTTEARTGSGAAQETKAKEPAAPGTTPSMPSAGRMRLVIGPG